MLDPRNDREFYRVPNDLAVDDSPIKRWLLVGSCLVNWFHIYVSRFADGAPGDFITINNGVELPPNPPRPIEEYDVQVVQIPLRAVVPDLAHARIAWDDHEGFEALYAQCAQRLDYCLNQALIYAREGKLPTVVTTLVVPQQNSAGRAIDGRDLRNFTFFVRQLNDRIADIVAELPNGFLLDFEDFFRSYGGKYFQDDALWALNHAGALSDYDHTSDQERLQAPAPASEHYRLQTEDLYHAMWQEIRGFFVASTGKGAVKLVIFDVDDTLWRGVVAERDDPDPGQLEGWPRGVAEAALYLKQRGIIIALVSKNSEERLREVWPKMWRGSFMIEDFASVRINWRDKAENVAEVIAEVNVLPDSVVFVDDNPVERHAVERAIPGVRTLGADLYYLRRILLWAPETQPAKITGEAARRNEMVKAQIKRENTRGTMDRAAFVASLEIVCEEIHVAASDHPRFDRVFELLNKSNQFNTSGKRWTRDAIETAFTQGLEVFAFAVADKFTDYGLVGMALVRAGVIEQFVMSCRVIGLDVELTCLDRIKSRHRELTGLYVGNDKNHLCKDLFARAGFAEEGGVWRWERPENAPAQAAYASQ